MAMAFIILLCRWASFKCSLAAFASLTALAIPAAPPPSAPKALKPAKIGISGRMPPVFGTDIILGFWIFRLIFLTVRKAILADLFKSESLPLVLIAFFARLTTLRNDKLPVAFFFLHLHHGYLRTDTSYLFNSQWRTVLRYRSHPVL